MPSYHIAVHFCTDSGWENDTGLRGMIETSTERSTFRSPLKTLDAESCTTADNSAFHIQHLNTCAEWRTFLYTLLGGFTKHEMYFVAQYGEYKKRNEEEEMGL